MGSEYLTVIATKLIQQRTALTTLLPSNSNYSVSVSEMQNVKTRENVGNKENTCFNTGVFVAFGRWILVPIGPEYCHFPLLDVKFLMFLFTFFYAAFSYSCFCTEFFSRFTLSSQVKLWWTPRRGRGSYFPLVKTYPITFTTTTTTTTTRMTSRRKIRRWKSWKTWRGRMRSVSVQTVPTSPGIFKCRRGSGQ